MTFICTLCSPRTVHVSHVLLVEHIKQKHTATSIYYYEEVKTS